jgi:sugar lactone lactonase YvrE
VTVYRHHGRSTLYVIDAGANTVSRVGRHGHLTVVSYLPNTPKADAIPTCIAQGPDGALYVTTLALVDGPGAAKIYRIDPSKHRSVFHSAKVWATGLTAMNGCAFSPGGKYFYVSELLATETLKGAPQGLPPAAVVKIPFAHPNSGRTYLGLSFLHFAGGVAVDRDGHVYVANFTAQGPGAPLGQVLRLKQ